MSLRDPEFRESLDGFHATAVLESEPKLPYHLVSACHTFPRTLTHITSAARECVLQLCSKWTRYTTLDVSLTVSSVSELQPVA